MDSVKEESPEGKYFFKKRNSMQNDPYIDGEYVVEDYIETYEEDSQAHEINPQKYTASQYRSNRVHTGPNIIYQEPV